jgi:broad specificity phosphatase PhoE
VGKAKLRNVGLIIDSAPILAWRRHDPDAAVGHAPHHHARPLLLGYRVHTLLCRGSGLPLLFFLAPANGHDAPFARPLLAWAVRLYGLRPRVIRLDAGYWGLRLLHWIRTVLGAVAVVPWNPKPQKNRTCLPPTWSADELGKRTSIERFFGRVFSLFRLFRLQRPPLAGWAAIASRVALTYAATVVVGLAAQQARRPDLIRSPKRVLAHTWEALVDWVRNACGKRQSTYGGSGGVPVDIVYETHSTSEDNEWGIATGWLDGRLSERGRRQAEELGQRRRHDGIMVVFPSDLGRAVETAALAFAGTDIPVITDARLRECNYGQLNGMSVIRLEAERMQHLDEPYPSGESYQHVVGRVATFLADLARNWEGARVLVIGHAATRWALDHLLTGVALEHLLSTPFDWRPGWSYALPSGWTRDDEAPADCSR